MINGDKIALVIRIGVMQYFLLSMLFQ